MTALGALGAADAGALDFDLPAHLDADAPPEARGGARHDVRLLVARRADGQVVHHRLTDLPALLAPGDLLVVNTSAMVPAALPATRPDGTVLRAHVSGPLQGQRRWLVELRCPVGADCTCTRPTPRVRGRARRVRRPGCGSPR
ncbi:MAG: S-adenosylmethionine:tRNA ribosyltransferase-isomerase [Egibacteraceae bacterium]